MYGQGIWEVSTPKEVDSDSIILHLVTISENISLFAYSVVQIKNRLNYWIGLNGQNSLSPNGSSMSGVSLLTRNSS